VAQNAPLTRDQHLWAAYLAGGGDAVLAGLTAAALEGLRGYPRPEIHVLVPVDRQVRRFPAVGPRIIVHRTSALPAAHIREHSPPHTTVARSIVDAAAWAVRDGDARAIVAAAFQQRRVDADGIDEVLRLLRRSRRRALVREAVRDSVAGAESLAEVDFCRLCRRYRLPRPELQQRRTDAAGRHRYLDAYWEKWRLHAEVDGSHHIEVRAWWADQKRQNDLWVSGDRVLRFPAWVVRHRPAEVAAQLRAALESAGWRANPLDLGQSCEP
jgi:very-short-patch-repair endonuclease